MNLSLQTQKPWLLQRHNLLLACAWLLWIVFTVGAMSVLAVGIPIRYSKLLAILRDFETLELSPNLLSVYALFFELLYAFAYCGVAIFMVLKRKQDLRVILFSIVLITLGVNQTYIAEISQVKILTAIAVAGLVIFLFLFPDARFTPHWTRVPALIWLFLSIAWFLFPTMPVNLIHTHTTDGVPLSFFAVLSTFMGLGLWSQSLRYRRAAYVEREQIKWLFFGLCFMAAGAVVQFSPWLNAPDTSPGGVLIRSPIAATLAILFPGSILFAIMQYRLWSIDWLINRTMVYSLTIMLLVAVYTLLISMLTTLARLMSMTQSQFVVSLIATGVVTALSQPLRDRLQRLANKLLFGDRDDPYTVIARLGRRLEAPLTPRAVLPTIVDTVREALKLPYVAVRVAEDDHDGRGNVGYLTSASSGKALASVSANILTLPLTHQAETVGYLTLSPRSPAESFSQVDLALLHDLARQVGIAVHALKLSTALERVREEERLQIQRDLHDSVGPTLAAQVLKSRSALTYLARGDTAAAARLLEELRTNLENVTSEVRQIATAIRPPILDRLGLAQALADQASQFEHSGLRIDFDAPTPLQALPHATEEAAYHIVREALTNVARHAQACHCSIRVTVEEAVLKLVIADDGCGLPEANQAGVGLGSMRERASRLRGSCVVSSGPDQGTTVTVHLPL
jgi:signal transduction histidine kinase